jgi:hypothetical protein
MKKMIISSILAFVTVLGVGFAVSNDGQLANPSVQPNIIYPDY